MPRILFILILVSQFCFGSETGMWGTKNENEKFYSNRLIAIPNDQGFIFHYYTEGHFRCEVIGQAKEISGVGGGQYVFINNKEYWYGQYEGYAGNPNCTISFNFTSGSVIITTKGECKSFCGAGGSLGSTMKRVSN